MDRSSRKRLDETEALEIALIKHLREAAPNMAKGDTSMLHLRVASQVLRDEGVVDPLPERLWRILAQHRRRRPRRGRCGGKHRDPKTRRGDRASHAATRVVRSRGDRLAAPRGRATPSRAPARGSAARGPGHGSSGRDHPRKAARNAHQRPGAERAGSRIRRSSWTAPCSGCTNRKSSASTRASRCFAPP